MSFKDQVYDRSNKSPRAVFIEEIAGIIRVSTNHVYRCLKNDSFQPLHKKIIAQHLSEDEQILFPN